jgi:hypothetical protein
VRRRSKPSDPKSVKNAPCASIEPRDGKKPPGDRDTTCAIVGTIVALSSRSVPQECESQREALPSLD